MVVTSKLRTHKVMEAAIRELMGAGTPPRFKFKDTYASIEFPSGYTIPAQATLEAKYDELLALEEDIQKAVVEGDLEVGTSNLFVDTETGDVGIGTDSPAYTLDVHGSSNVGALTATSLSGDGSGLSALNATNLTSGTVQSARLSLVASDIPSLDAGKITTGTLVAARIPNLSADKITTGTLGTARIPNLSADKITTGTLVAARIPNLSADKITTGTLTRPISTTTGTFSGDVVTGSNFYVGTNTNNETAKTIYFGGTYGDNSYDHCVIERRVWSTGTEKQELLLFSGNDGETSSGPDRIRLKGAQILFDTLNSSTDRTTENTKMIIRADGDVGIGSTSPSYKLDVNGTIYASGDVIMFSDERKKTHIETIPNALEKVLQLRGVTFNKLDDDNRRHSGVIAQEVEKVLPEVVYTAEDDTKSVAYGNMIGLLIEAIKELAESRT
jgi:hypothetical protein